MDSEQRLQYTLAYMLSSSDEVLFDAFQKLVNEFLENFNSVAMNDRPQMQKVASQLCLGLRNIHSDHKTYTKLFNELPILIAHLEAAIQPQIFTQSESQHLLTASDLLASPFDCYPFAIIQEVFMRQFGPRLANHVLNTYFDGSELVDRETLKLLLVAVATDVRLEDLAFAANRSSDTLTQSDIHFMLNRFRTTPEGRSLLQSFNIPLVSSHHKIDSSYLATLPENTLFEMNRKVALQVFADIESAFLWHPERSIRMDEKTCLAKLSQFVANPNDVLLFNQDCLLHFLDVAAMCLGVIEMVKKDKQLVTSVLKPLLAIIKKSFIRSSQMYRGYTRHSGYVKRWSELHQLLKGAVRDLNSVNTSAYLENLMRHPNHKHSEDPVALTKEILGYEYLARKVGYWNKYFLEDSGKRYIDELGTSKDPTIRELRKGSFVPLFENGDWVYYHVREVIQQGGMVCQILMPAVLPVDAVIPIKIVFQGTIIQSASYYRDHPAAPGYEYWEVNGLGEILGRLLPLLDEVSHTQPNARFYFSLTGHSLGGADSQNAGALLAEFLVNNPKYQAQIEKMQIISFNAAGVPKSAAEKYQKAHQRMPHLFGPVIHSTVTWDYVSRSGETKVGVGVGVEVETPKMLILEVRNPEHLPNEKERALARHCDLPHVNSDLIRIRRILCPKNNSDEYRAQITGVGVGLNAIMDHIAQRISWSPAGSALNLASSSSTYLAPTYRTAIQTDEEIENQLDYLQRQINGLSTGGIIALATHSDPKKSLEDYRTQRTELQREIKQRHHLTPEQYDLLMQQRECELEEIKQIADASWDNLIASYNRASKGGQILDGTDF